MHAVQDILRQGLMVTGFVLIMMLVIEYLNVLTRGNWDRVIGRWTWGQSALASFLGVTPGCLGAYAVASLYIHRVLSIGALTAAMVATCGDEAFVMLALFPAMALKIFAALFVGGLVTGVAVDFVARSRRSRPIPHDPEVSASHTQRPECVPFSGGELLHQWRRCSPHRGWLALFLAIFIGGVLTGAIGHEHAGEHASEAPMIVHGDHAAEQDHDDAEHGSEEAHEESGWNWVRITLLVAGLIALGIVATVPDHFLDEHLWDHLVRVHAWRVLLWTLGAVAVTHVLVERLDVGTAIEAHRLSGLVVLVIACLTGVLPASGPHLVFVTLYAEQAIPLSILLANCVVQDGHGLIPTLAHSRRAFLAVKAIKMVLGLGLGLLGIARGW